MPDDNRPAHLRPVQDGQQDVHSPAAENFVQAVEQKLGDAATWRAQESEDRKAIAVLRQRSTLQNWKLVRDFAWAFGLAFVGTFVIGSIFKARAKAKDAS